MQLAKKGEGEATGREGERVAQNEVKRRKEEKRKDLGNDGGGKERGRGKGKEPLPARIATSILHTLEPEVATGYEEHIHDDYPWGDFDCAKEKGTRFGQQCFDRTGKDYLQNLKRTHGLGRAFSVTFAIGGGYRT